MLDFAYQYFGTTEPATVERVILLNNLDNSDIWCLPKGKLMKYITQ